MKMKNLAVDDDEVILDILRYEPVMVALEP